MAGCSSIRIADYRGIREMAPHRHDEDILCLPLSGNYLERTRGRETVHRLGDILFCPAGEAHSQCFGTGRVVKLLMVPTSATRDILAAHLPLATAPFARSAMVASMAGRLAWELRHADDQSRLIAEGLMLQIAGLFARVGEGETGIPAWLRQARDYVLGHAFEATRLADVASHVGRPESRLTLAYRRAFGCTVGEDARAIRLKRAAELLAGTREPIAQIASSCGYFDQAHLTRMFKHAYGMTPLAYRASFN